MRKVNPNLLKDNDADQIQSDTENKSLQLYPSQTETGNIRFLPKSQHDNKKKKDPKTSTTDRKMQKNQSEKRPSEYTEDRYDLSGKSDAPTEKGKEDDSIENTDFKLLTLGNPSIQHEQQHKPNKRQKLRPLHQQKLKESSMMLETKHDSSRGQTSIKTFSNNTSQFQKAVPILNLDRSNNKHNKGSVEDSQISDMIELNIGKGQLNLLKEASTKNTEQQLILLEGLGLNDKGVITKKKHGLRNEDGRYDRILKDNKRINSARSSKIQKEMQFLSQLKEMEETMSHHGFAKVKKHKRDNKDISKRRKQESQYSKYHKHDQKSKIAKSATKKLESGGSSENEDSVGSASALGSIKNAMSDDSNSDDDDQEAQIYPLERSASEVSISDSDNSYSGDGSSYKKSESYHSKNVYDEQIQRAKQKLGPDHRPSEMSALKKPLVKNMKLQNLSPDDYSGTSFGRPQNPMQIIQSQNKKSRPLRKSNTMMSGDSNQEEQHDIGSLVENINQAKTSSAKTQIPGLQGKNKLSLQRKNSMDVDDITGDMMPQVDSTHVKQKDKLRVERMRYRENKQPFVFYPEDQFKSYWDLFITLILLISCLITPWRIAFGELEEPMGWFIANVVVDSLFGIDILVIFNSAYYDDEYLIIDDHKAIASSYIKGWLLLDILAIIPFDLLFQSDNYQELARFARIGRMYKIIKMTRLLRILKIVKQRTQLLKYLNDILKIGLGFERLFFFMILSLISCHILSCIWVIAAQLNKASDEDYASWIDDYTDLDTGSLYVTAVYYTVTTITTVGYGDINGQNTLERSFSIVIMIIGVISFTFATGSLSSILQNYDQANAKLQERIAILNRIYKEFYLPLDLYTKLRQAVKYDFNKDKNDINSFVAELPHKLKLEVSLFIHEQTYKKIDCFKGRSSAFIAWICPLLRPQPYPEKQYIYFEGDDITSIYFLIRGKAGFVLPKYRNATYIDFGVGIHFGIIDIVGSILQAKYDLDNWIGHKDLLQRQFTVMALKESEVLCLSVQDLNRMKQEFLEAYEKLFSDAYNRLRRSLTLKLKAMKICADMEGQQLSGRSNASSVDLACDQEQKDLTKELNFTPQEQSDLKAQELNYQIQAIQLNKIDEESVEGSSQEEDSEMNELIEESQALGATTPQNQPPLTKPNEENVTEEEDKSDYDAFNIQPAVAPNSNKSNTPQKEFESSENLSDLSGRQQNKSISALKKRSKSVRNLGSMATDHKNCEGADKNSHDGKKHRLDCDFDANELKLVQKAKPDDQVEEISRDLISKVKMIQKGNTPFQRQNTPSALKFQGGFSAMAYSPQVQQPHMLYKQIPDGTPSNQKPQIGKQNTFLSTDKRVADDEYQLGQHLIGGSEAQQYASPPIYPSIEGMLIEIMGKIDNLQRTQNTEFREIHERIDKLEKRQVDKSRDSTTKKGEPNSNKKERPPSKIPPQLERKKTTCKKDEKQLLADATNITKNLRKRQSVLVPNKRQFERTRQGVIEFGDIDQQIHELRRNLAGSTVGLAKDEEEKLAKFYAGLAVKREGIDQEENSFVDKVLQQVESQKTKSEDNTPTKQMNQNKLRLSMDRIQESKFSDSQLSQSLRTQSDYTPVSSRMQANKANNLQKSFGVSNNNYENSRNLNGTRSQTITKNNVTGETPVKTNNGLDKNNSSEIAPSNVTDPQNLENLSNSNQNNKR